MSTLRREDVPHVVSQLLDSRPVRWVPPERVLGDYDGRSRTLEVFNADPKEQRQLLRRLRPERPAIEQAAGGPVIVIFHTRKETRRLYGGVLPDSGAASEEPTFLELPATPAPDQWVDTEVRIGQVAAPRRMA